MVVHCIRNNHWKGRGPLAWKWQLNMLAWPDQLQCNVVLLLSIIFAKLQIGGGQTDNGIILKIFHFFNEGFLTLIQIKSIFIGFPKSFISIPPLSEQYTPTVVTKLRPEYKFYLAHFLEEWLHIFKLLSDRKCHHHDPMCNFVSNGPIVAVIWNVNLCRQFKCF